jgi:hypothetical protein
MVVSAGEVCVICKVCVGAVAVRVWYSVTGAGVTEM